MLGIAATAAALVGTAGCWGPPSGERSAGAPPASGPGEASALPPRPDVIVFLVDTLRADAVGFGGARRPTSPRLDRHAGRGVVFERATTPAGWTRPAVVSLFSGLYPASHGVQDKEHVAPDALVMLAEVLRDAGYRTVGLVSNFAVDASFGLGQGFERFHFFDKKTEAHPGDPPQLNYVSIAGMDAAVRAVLRERSRRPLFLYVHTTDPHYPYLPPAEYRVFGDDSRARYDGEVLYTDAHIGAWLDELERSGRAARSLVVLTADHGEEFHEHGGTGHGITVFEECVRVPLVLWAPGLAPARRAELVSLADLPATILEAAALPAPEGFAPQSRSLWGLARGAAAPAGWSWAYSELVYPSKGIAFGYREDEYKVVRIVQDKLGRRGVTSLFRVSADPFEQRDLAAREPEAFRRLVATMTALRRDHRRASIASETRALEGEALERMRGLGYVD